MPTWLVMLTCGLPPHRRSSADARSRSSATVDTSNAGLLAASCAALCIVCSIAVFVASAISSWVAPNASATGFRDAHLLERRAAIVNTDRRISMAIHTPNWNRRQFWRVFGTPRTSNQNHMMRESLNCSYARSSQRNLRERMKSANQSSANTASVILWAFSASALTI
jgi:hypothetical protein